MKYIAFLLFTISFKFALASNVSANSRFSDIQDLTIYSETINNCESGKKLYKTILNSNNWNSFIISAGQSFDLFVNSNDQQKKIEHLLSQNMLGDYAFDRLKSEGFVRALSECYPNDQYMKSAYIYSMITADTIGKIPTLITAFYSFKLSKSLWSRFAGVFPRTTRVIQASASIAVVLLSVIEAKTKLNNRELTDYEKERIKRISAGIKNNVDESRALVYELAQEELSIQQQRLTKATSKEEAIEIEAHINRIKSALQKMS